MAENQSKRVQSVEFLRFVGCCIIVYFHVLHHNIIPFTNDSALYRQLASNAGEQGVIVEFFLLVSGFFLFRSTRDRQQPVAVTVLDKFVRLWPVLLFYSVFQFLFLDHTVRASQILDLFFLRCTGISMDFAGIIWYIGPFFWGTLLLAGLQKVLDKGKLTLVLALLAYWGYAINLNTTGGELHREIALEVVSLGFARVIAGLSLGYLVSSFWDALQCAFVFSMSPRGKTATATAVETVLLLFLGIRFFTPRLAGITEQSFVYVLLFAILIVSLSTNCSLLSRLCTRFRLGALGKYAYSIYVMQQISFDLLKRTLWKNTALVLGHPYPTCIVSVAFSVLVGIAVYFLVERPCAAAYRRWKQTHLRQTEAGKVTQ